MAANALSILSEITIQEAVLCIKAMGNDVPAMIWGEPGLGKTKTIDSEFKKSGYTMVHVLAGQSEPTDIQGIPFNFKDLYAKYLLPWWAWLASDDKEVPAEFQGPLVLFFDDIVTAPEQTQAAFYKLIDEKHLGGGLKLRQNVRIIAAGNRVDDMSAVVDMPKALCNRFMHYYTKPDLDTWLGWATSAGRIHPHIVFYLRRNGMYLSNFEDAKKSGEHAWASPRTWEMLSKSLYALEAAGLRREQIEKTVAKNEKEAEGMLNSKDLEYVAVQGCIGKLVTHFLSHIKSQFSAVLPEVIIKNPDKAEVPPIQEVDRLWATVANLERWMNDPVNFDHYEAIMTYALRLPNEFGFLLAKQLLTLISTGNNIPDVKRSKAVDSTIFRTVAKKWGASLRVF